MGVGATLRIHCSEMDFQQSSSRSVIWEGSCVLTDVYNEFVLWGLRARREARENKSRNVWECSRTILIHIWQCRYCSNVMYCMTSNQGKWGEAVLGFLKCSGLLCVPVANKKKVFPSQKKTCCVEKNNPCLWKCYDSNLKLSCYRRSQTTATARQTTVKYHKWVNNYFLRQSWEHTELDIGHMDMSRIFV